MATEVQRYPITFRSMVCDVRTQFLHFHVAWKPLFDHSILKWMEVGHHIIRAAEQVESHLKSREWKGLVAELKKPVTIGAMNAFRDWRRLMEAATPRSEVIAPSVSLITVNLGSD